MISGMGDPIVSFSQFLGDFSEALLQKSQSSCPACHNRHWTILGDQLEIILGQS